MKKMQIGKQRAAKAALKARGVKLGKKSKTNRFGQATGGWSPFAAPEVPTAWRMCPVCDGAGQYDAFDRARGEWFTYTCGDC